MPNINTMSHKEKVTYRNWLIGAIKESNEQGQYQKYCYFQKRLELVSQWL